MAKYEFQLEEPKDNGSSATYRLIHVGKVWNTPKDVYLTKYDSSGNYVCTAEYNGVTASSRFMAGDGRNMLTGILKKQGLKNRKAMMAAKFPNGTDQKVLNSWHMILNCLSFSKR